MLLLVTHREDLTADWLVLELDRRGATFERFNTEDYPVDVRLRWTAGRASLDFGDRSVVSNDVTAVWWRRALPPQLPSSLPYAEAEWASGEAQAALDGFWRTTNAHWVNPPSANAGAASKPEQLQRARRLGFDVPETLVTNDLEAARLFLRAHPRSVCKSLRSGRLPSRSGETLFYTSIVSTDDLAGGTSFGPEPYLFQSFVDKVYDVRVTVIGSEAYACRIDSQSEADGHVDWRRSGPERLAHKIEHLPWELADRCVNLTHSYGLRFSAIDLARRADGRYAFFEINPNGQWAWIERLTGLPLAARLADELQATA